MSSYRGQFAKKVIKEALVELLRDQEIEKITVSDLCSKAGVSRQTFYNHFSDKYAVSQWFFDSICEQYLYETGRSLSFRDAFLLNTQALADNRDFFGKPWKARGYQSLFAYARRVRMQTLIETLRDYKGIEVAKDVEDLIRYHVEGETCLVLRWVEGGMADSAECLTELILDATPRRLYELLKDPVSSRGREG